MSLFRKIVDVPATLSRIRKEKAAEKARGEELRAKRLAAIDEARAAESRPDQEIRESDRRMEQLLREERAIAKAGRFERRVDVIGRILKPLGEAQQAYNAEWAPLFNEAPEEARGFESITLMFGAGGLYESTLEFIQKELAATEDDASPRKPKLRKGDVLVRVVKGTGNLGFIGVGNPLGCYQVGELIGLEASVAAQLIKEGYAESIAA